MKFIYVARMKKSESLYFTCFAGVGVTFGCMYNLLHLFLQYLIPSLSFNI